jgi:OOP family OmpA-OmpF porin
MAKNCIKLMIFLMISTLLIGCSQLKLKPEMSPPQFMSYNFPDAKYTPKVDNFLVILDASESMAQRYVSNYSVKETKFDHARDFLYAMNQTIPDMDITAGLRSLGHHASVSKEGTALFYKMAGYNALKYESAIDAVSMAGGLSPLATAITAGTEDLKKVQGKKAVIIVSDGKDMKDTELLAAKAMKDAFGDNLCIYTVLVGDDPEGESLLKQIADIGKCGFAVRANDFHTSSDMGDFVSKVFLGGAAKVAEMGAVLFDLNKSDIKSQYFPVLDRVVAMMKNNLDIKMEVQGHADNSGTEIYNLSLSQKRAENVVAYLVKKGIAANRFKALGYGYFKPAAPNSTKEGRAKNRRAEFLKLR